MLCCCGPAAAPEIRPNGSKEAALKSDLPDPDQLVPSFPHNKQPPPETKQPQVEVTPAAGLPAVTISLPSQQSPLQPQQSTVADVAPEALQAGQTFREGEEGSQHTGSPRKLTPEEREAEKDRLRKLVKEFANQAVAGMAMTVVEAGSGKVVDVQLTMDKQLTTLTIKGDSTSAGEYSLREVTSIFRGADILKKEADFRQDLLNTTAGVDLNRGASRLFFKFPDAAERDKFYTCIKILRVSFETKKKQN